jgi:hypothetical protein
MFLKVLCNGIRNLEYKYFAKIKWWHFLRDQISSIIVKFPLKNDSLSAQRCLFPFCSKYTCTWWYLICYSVCAKSLRFDGFSFNGEISDVFTWGTVLKRINVFCLLRLYWVSLFSLCLRWGGEVTARRSVCPHLHCEGAQVGGCAVLTWELHVS